MNFAEFIALFENSENQQPLLHIAIIAFRETENWTFLAAKDLPLKIYEYFVLRFLFIEDS